MEPYICVIFLLLLSLWIQKISGWAFLLLFNAFIDCYLKKKTLEWLTGFNYIKDQYMNKNG